MPLRRLPATASMPPAAADSPRARRPPAPFLSVPAAFLKILIVILLLALFLRDITSLFPQPWRTPPLRLAGLLPEPTSANHILFGVASTSRLWPSRRRLVRIWWRPGVTRGFAFLDSPLHDGEGLDDGELLPPVRVSEDTSRFPYKYPRGLRSAVRVARIAKELADAAANETGVRWLVLCDDDTVFAVDNLVATLRKYDYSEWWYIGGRSESAAQNAWHSFGMAYGGGGIAISYPLAQALGRVLDSCLMRYPRLYGSDARISSCIAELGIELSHEPGFHQVDFRGDMSGFLMSHPLAPFVSIHHVDAVDPIFPGMNRTAALEHLFEAANFDPRRLLQQTVCYDRKRSLTVSVSWGYAVQVIKYDKRLPDVVAVQKTFVPFKRGRNASDLYLFDTREYPRDHCKRPAVFFMKNFSSSQGVTNISYSRHLWGHCQTSEDDYLKLIKVSSSPLTHTPGKFLRRHCCDILPSPSETMMSINIRRCKNDELIAMHPMTRNSDVTT